MNRKWILPTLTFTALGFALTFVVVARPKAPSTLPPASPASATDSNLVAATGLVEPESETIQISCAVSGMVTKVFAPAGTQVAAKMPLFEIDGRDLQAQLGLKQSQMAAQQARLNRLLAEPRPEELPAFEARVEQSKAQMEDAQTRYDLIKSVSDERAVTSENILGRKHALDTAKAQYLQSVADLNLKKAGAWKPEIAQSRADVAQAEADVEQTRRLIQRLTIRAPMDGKVLQSRVRLGQYANCASTDALMLFGGGKHLNVRAQIDENDAWRARPATATYGYVRGNTEHRLALRFVRFEPYIVPKKSLTGDTTERVDTRVLEVIYQIEDQNANVYPGQQMDVFTETPVASPISSPTASATSTTDPAGKAR